MPFQTVLENNAPGAPGDDDFELWDQSQMLAHQQRNVYNKTSVCCKPSCIPITFILILIVLVVLLPLLDHQNDKQVAKSNSTFGGMCPDACRWVNTVNSFACKRRTCVPSLITDHLHHVYLVLIAPKWILLRKINEPHSPLFSIQLVESIPEGLLYPDGSPSFMSTFDAWQMLIAQATKTITIGSFYWSLKSDEVYNHSSSWQGDKIFQQLLSAGIDRKIDVKIAQSAPTQVSPNIDTEILVKRKAAKVRSVNFPKLLGGGVLHTKLWIIDNTHFYLGSANMDWRSLTQVSRKHYNLFIVSVWCIFDESIRNER